MSRRATAAAITRLHPPLSDLMAEAERFLTSREAGQHRITRVLLRLAS